MRRARIIATIGSASNPPEMLRRLMEAGMDVARLNMSHGDHDSHDVSIQRIRQTAAELNKPVAILMDLAGPKIRTGKLKAGEVELAPGSELCLTAEDTAGDARRVSVNYPLLAHEVRPGDRLLISDGSLEVTVAEIRGGDVVARVTRGGTLRERQGVNLPGARLSLPSLTEKDLADLQFGVSRDVDLVALSFVRRADDCRLLQERLAGLGSKARTIAKIEKPEAVEDIGAILEVVDAVMVARGDLAVETSPEAVPLLQKRVISEALRRQKMAITATQMLQSMIENAQPTRAEASDVANATIDGSDALMLSGETAIGRYPVEAVAMMDRIIRSTEEGLVSLASALSGNSQAPAPENLTRMVVQCKRSGSYTRALAEAAAFAAQEMDCRIIVAFTQSGHMARCVAALRPGRRIVALTPSQQTCRQLALTWGVESYVLDDYATGSENLIHAAERFLLQAGLVNPGESIVLVAGQAEDPAVSNSMKLHRV